MKTVNGCKMMKIYNCIIALHQCSFAVIKRYKAMASKWMYMPNNDTQNYPFCRLQ